MCNCIKPKDFCMRLQEEDECDELFIHKCGSSICTQNNTTCTHYIKMNSYLKLLIQNKVVDTQLLNKFLKANDKIMKFNDEIKNCDYKFDPKDLCMLKQTNCIEKIISPTEFGYRHVNYKVDCKCPTKLNIKCDQYCSVHLEACKFFRSNEKLRKNITQCKTNKAKVFSSFFSLNG